MVEFSTPVGQQLFCSYSVGACGHCIRNRLWVSSAAGFGVFSVLVLF